MVWRHWNSCHGAGADNVARHRKRGPIVPTLIGRQAIVVGAGMGGLTAARALADYFERVVILESDRLPVDPLDRAGTPQGRHVHALLAGGQHALEGLFSGFERALVEGGAVPIRVGLDLR